MPSPSKFLTHLERYDTLHAADALSAALDDCLADEQAEPALRDSALALWEQWRQADGSSAWDALVAWADERLTAWHSLKTQAIQSAWEQCPRQPAREDLEAMRQRVLTDLREGLAQNPDLVADGHFVQALARQSHSFSFTQALRELRGEGVNLPADDKQMVTHCAICANAFQYLILPS